jgi:hypothetical protein
MAYNTNVGSDAITHTGAAAHARATPFTTTGSFLLGDLEELPGNGPRLDEGNPIAPSASPVHGAEPQVVRPPATVNPEESRIADHGRPGSDYGVDTPYYDPSLMVPLQEQEDSPRGLNMLFGQYVDLSGLNTASQSYRS